MKKWICVGLALGSVLIALLARRESPKMDHKTAGLPDRADYPDRVGSQPPSSSVQIVAVPRQEPSHEEGRAPEAPSAPATPGGAAPTDEDQLALIKSVFSAQPIDTTWAREARRKIADFLEPLRSEQVAVNSVDCRSTLCRVEFAIAESIDVGSVVNRFLAIPPDRGWSGPMRGQRESVARDGTVIYSVFLAKDGTQMPFLE